MQNIRVGILVIGGGLILLLVIALVAVGLNEYSLGSSRTGIYRSTDGGTSFEHLTNIRGTTERTLEMSLANVSFFEGDPEVMFVFSQARGVYTTTNGGDAWTRIFAAGKRGIYITDMEVHPRDEDTIYVGGRKGGRARIYKTEDGGDAWTEVYVEPVKSARVRGLVIDRSQPQRVVAALSTGVILRTENGGEDWTLARNFENITPRNLLEHPQETETLYLTTRTGLYVSSDQGRSFDERALPIVDPSAVTVNPNGGDQLFVGGEGEMYRSVDRGESWTEIPILTPDRPGLVQDIAVRPGNSRVLYYSVRDVLYFSRDGGEFWRTIEADVSGNIIDSILIHPANRDMLYLSVK